MDHRMPAGGGGGPGLGQKVSGPTPKSNHVTGESEGTVPTPPGSTSTCLFCIDPVIIAMRAGGPDAQNPEKIRQLVKNLCHHMQLDHQQLPNEFTRIKFPFCDSCIEPIVELLECQKIIDDANARITTAVAKIEQIVAEAEILNLDSSMQPMSSSAALMDQQRFSKLRNMILEVIRKKLIIQKNLRKNLKAQVQPSEDVENMTTNVNATDIDATTAEESALQVGNDCESTQDDEDWRSDRGQNFSAHEDSPLPPDAQDEENSGIPVITNVRGGPSIVQQETSRASPDGNDTEIQSNDSNSPSPPIGTGTGSRKRKMLFEGIKILKGTYADGGGDFLQCSSCPHRIPITKYYENKIGMAYARMKIHIKNTHQQKKKQGPAKKQKKIASATLAAKKTKVFSRSYCKKKFVGLQTLQAHKKTHVNHCEICGRLVKGGVKNLMTHKFTHKNDQERKAAFAAREQGANNTLLAKKSKTPLFRKKVVPVGSTATNANFKCRFCPRKFGKKCYLSLHMKTHGSASNTKPPKLQKEKVRSYPQKKLRTEPNNGIETNGSGASSSLPLPQLANFEIPAGVCLDDVDIEESDVIDHSGESSSNEWYINGQENGMGEVDDGSSSDDD